MTTIAFDGKFMAGDSQTTGDFKFSSEPKVFFFDGSVFGCAGESQKVQRFKSWICHDERESKDLVFDKDADFCALEWNGARLFLYGSDLVRFPVSIPYACGSGANFAMGAMFAGADAQKAVSIASALDPFTGGDVTVIDCKRS